MTATKKTAAKKATAKAEETFEERKARLDAKAKREAKERMDAVNADLQALADSVTQREWLLICKRLDVTRDQIHEDTGLRHLALAWVRQKRAHGGAEWDKLLAATDEELIAYLGYDLDGNPIDQTPED